ncbi:MAG: hypothetical protein U0132_14400, partial [Gemmatimonadaceae bacterium]
KTPAVDLLQLARLSREMYEGAHTANLAFAQARGLAAQLERIGGADADAFRAQVDSVAPASSRGGGRAAAFRRRFGPQGPPTLESVSQAMMSAAMAMQGADVAPTTVQVAACGRARSQLAESMAKWNALRTSGLAAFNAKRRAAGQPAITIPE